MSVKIDRPFVNQFWGLHDDGFPVAQARIKSSLATLEELLQFYKNRIAIEKEYSKKLEKMNSAVVLGSGETGTLKIALEKLQIETQNMVEMNHKFSRSVALQNYEKIHNFYQIYLKNVTKLESHMQKVLARKRESLLHVQTTKERYRQNCSQIKSLLLICQTTWGKELDKNTAKLNKLELGSDALKYQYQAAVKNCRDIHEIWVRDWSIALLNLYQLEIERIQMCKLNCFSYCNNIASLCVDLDHCADASRGVFAKVAAPRDIHDFAESYGTGDKIPDVPEYVDFMSGDDESGPTATDANFKDPDYSQILTRTFSVQSGMASPARTAPGAPGAANTARPGISTRNSFSANGSGPLSPRSGANVSPQADSTHISGHILNGSPRLRTPATKALPVIREPLLAKLPPKFNLALMSPGMTNGQKIQLEPLATQNLSPAKTGGMALRKVPSRNSAYTAGTDDRAEVFDDGNRLQTSNGLLEYLNPTNYTSHTGSSGNGQTGSSGISSGGNSGKNGDSGARSWSSPRRTDHVVREVQDQINRRLRDMTDVFANSTVSRTQYNASPKASVPLAKDFSIDFMAKALEDLNAGGDGDVTQFRRSVRNASRNDDSTILPALDFVNDADEVAVRHDSAVEALFRQSGANNANGFRNGNTTGTARADTISFRRPRPKSMVESVNYNEESLSGTIVRTEQRQARLFLQSPTKSYTNLHQLLEKVTPVTRNNYVTKAVAKYTYNSREKGELSFRKGWHMYVIHKQEDNWYVCELGENCGSGRGTVGLVPYNYVAEGDLVF